MNMHFVRYIFLQILYFSLYPLICKYSFVTYYTEALITNWSVYLIYSSIFCIFLMMAKPSEYVKFIQISGYFIVAPMVIYFLVRNEYFYLVVVVLTYMPIILLGVFEFKFSKIKGFKLNKRFISSAYISFVVLVSLTKQPNLEFFIDPTSIYLHRAENQSLLDIYIIKIFTWILTPFFLISKSMKLSISTFIVILISALLMYSVYGHKTLIGFPVGLFFLYKFSNTERIMQFGILLLLGIGAIALVFNQNIIAAIFIRRIFYVPAYTGHQWLNTFWNDQPAFWGTVFPFNLINYYPYSEPLIRIMSEKIGGWPNVNFVTDILVNANILGWFYMFLLALLIKVSSQLMMPSNSRMFILLISLLYLNTGVTIFWFGPLFIALYLMLLIFRCEDAVEIRYV